LLNSPAQVDTQIMLTTEQKKKNQRLGIALASIAVIFFLGFLAKMALLGLG